MRPRKCLFLSHRQVNFTFILASLHCTDEAQKAETVLSAVRQVNSYISFLCTFNCSEMVEVIIGNKSKELKELPNEINVDKQAL